MARLQTSTRLAKKQETVNTQVGDELREQAKNAAQNIDSGYMDLAEALFEIKNKEHYREWGIADGTFKGYVESELGIGHSKGQALVNIWDKMKALNLSRERLLAIGWSKARAMCRVVDSSNVEELFEDAENMSFVEFEQRVKEIKAARDGVSAPSRQGFLVLKVQAGSSEAANISQALDAAKKNFETESDAVALGQMALQWFSEFGNEGLVVPLEKIIPLLERTYGGKFHHEAGDLNALDEEAEEDFTTVTEEEEPIEQETSAEDDEDEVPVKPKKATVKKKTAAKKGKKKTSKKATKKDK